MAAGLVDLDARRRGTARADPLAIAYFLLFAGLIGIGLVVTLFGDPQAGNSTVVLDLKPAGPHGSADQAMLRPAQTQITEPAESAAPAILEAVYAGRALVADPALIENTPQGPLPRVADDGRAPMNVYAPPAVAAKGPRIALVVMGLGLSAKATAAALDGLPAAVTLAFAPHAGDVQSWVNQARERGHEVLLEIPMEPFDYPDSDPGPHTLRAGTSAQANAARLDWSLSRFTGYAGVVNFLGGRLLTDSDALEPVLTTLGRRGLMFFDDGSVANSVVPDVARRVNAPFVQSVAVIDEQQDAIDIDRRLSDLEARAHANGTAAATAFVYPITIARIAQWAKGLSGRGFVLVSASAIVAGK
jgi:polysaccharide deacetylase 2 family uncharacterized protein YibQ